MDDARAMLGPVGIWSTELRGADRPEVREAAAELDELGFPALWTPGLGGAGALEDAGHLLGAAPRATLALGVLSIWGLDPGVLGARLAQLDDAQGARTLVGLGISNAHSAAGAGQTYGSPITAMGGYLDQLDSAAAPVPAGRRFLGALGPRMADLAAARTAGWHPFLVPPSYVAEHRARVGPAPVIAPHQAVVLDRDPHRARSTARAGIGAYLGFPAYRSNLMRLGFGEDDLVPGGSDRLIDALVARGDVGDVAARVRAHHEAGADHVALHVLGADPQVPPLQQWRELAGLLASPAER